MVSDYDRIIFHIDVNSAFLSWSATHMLENGYPTDIREIPSIIGGDQASRHGIVLAKSVPAKVYGIVTGEPIVNAKRKCPNLAVYPSDHMLYKEKSKAKIKELSEQFNLQSILDKKAGKLSGGWQRRVSIAMALISEPKILFLDEPTLGLDVIARSELWDTIRCLKGKITVILTTHYMEEAEALSDRIGIMKDGKLLVVGTSEELKSKAECEKFEDAFIKIVKEAK